jgi:hypothetical protein
MKKVTDSSSEKTDVLKVPKNWDEVTELEMALGVMPDKVPKGFRTIAEWAKIWGRNRCSAEKIIAGHVLNGRMDVKKFRIQTNKQKSRPILHYRAIK